ncbi:MAG: hypothetical protein ACM33B_15660 [Pseudomonadota bacterium]
MAQFHNTFEGDNYGQINQAGRDVNVTALDALRATEELRAALSAIPLPPEDLRAADNELDGVERELRRTDPNRQSIARRLDRVTELLKSAGAFTAAGAALFGPIGALAGFLGPLGDAVVSRMRD